ncbi:2-aminoethylphosphonate--pyruvate transaminase [Paraburkholderia sp. BCC1876]|uniref:2-aminoethylphosphonate--pyruvate transaminase n=1 Tax=Paraburkholderia sp. BCC1876 TaxID=2676303 RepID=UPI0015902AA4|nr:2-aminoethylphosphonate--pyruvate transaminase [Paraburkholderia sp. BCC1876]
MNTEKDPVLLTPGPLTTSLITRSAMLRDWGSWDTAFNSITASLRADLVDIVNGRDTHVCVPLQGSGTFSVEAALGTLVPRDGKVLVPQNGAYCKRVVRICEYMGRAVVELPIAESTLPTGAMIEEALLRDPAITHVAQVHCETGTGTLNPLQEIAQICARLGKGLIIDAMSSFGAIEIDVRTTPFDALVAASGKCLEGLPGMGFVIARRAVLEKCQGHSASLSMDLYDQWVYMEKTSQWRFTPPTSIVAALRTAVDLFKAEGGQAARGKRYQANCDALINGMEELGFRTFLPRNVQAPIIVTFHAPEDPAYEFRAFYEKVKSKGFILYPGKLTEVDTFRVGCIGDIDRDVMQRAVRAIEETLAEMGVKQISSREMTA